jgi:hypothetical protein
LTKPVQAPGNRGVASTRAGRDAVKGTMARAVAKA